MPRAFVTNVYDVSDYTGVFVNGTGGVLGNGTSKSLGANRNKGGYVIQESTGVDVLGGTVGTSIQMYSTSQDDWIYGEAPIGWRNPNWLTPYGDMYA